MTVATCHLTLFGCCLAWNAGSMYYYLGLSTVPRMRHIDSTVYTVPVPGPAASWPHSNHTHHRPWQTLYIPILCMAIYGHIQCIQCTTRCETIFFADSEGTGLSIQSRMSFSNLLRGRILPGFVGSVSSHLSYLATFSTRISLILDIKIVGIKCALSYFLSISANYHLRPEHCITKLSSTTLLLRSGFIYQVPFYSTF